MGPAQRRWPGLRRRHTSGITSPGTLPSPRSLLALCRRASGSHAAGDPAEPEDGPAVFGGTGGSGRSRTGSGDLKPGRISRCSACWRVHGQPSLEVHGQPRNRKRKGEECPAQRRWHGLRHAPHPGLHRQGPCLRRGPCQHLVGGRAKDHAAEDPAKPEDCPAVFGDTDVQQSVGHRMCPSCGESAWPTHPVRRRAGRRPVGGEPRRLAQAPSRSLSPWPAGAGGWDAGEGVPEDGATPVRAPRAGG